MAGNEPDPEWTNQSVRDFAAGRDPVEAVTQTAGSLLLAAADAGLPTQPLNPFELAEHLGIKLRPRYDVRDAQLVQDLSSDPGPAESGPDQRRQSVGLNAFKSAPGLTIEYNPTRPPGRLRYSVAHELAHALFDDAGLKTRHRTPQGALEHATTDDNWQLELLCNIAAAELLMPSTEMLGITNTSTDIDFLMAQRARFDVSTEALLRRFVHACERQIDLVALSRTQDHTGAPLRVDYVLSSRYGDRQVEPHQQFAATSIFAAPVAVGQTARGLEPLQTTLRSVQVVGVSPYPGARSPRVLAIVEPPESVERSDKRLQFVTADISDAVQPEPGAVSDGNDVTRRLIAHVVSDSARAWGKTGVAGSLARHVPDAARAFRSWAIADPDNLALGNVHIVDVPASTGGPMVDIASMVVQSGFGPSSTPRLSYVALGEALERIADIAQQQGREVHIPRIGAGQAGGRWDLIETTIGRTLLDRGIKTVVYTKPSRSRAARATGSPQ
ncbi:ImmA/IrrE family metallo-endopeptidase [Nocardioides baculatus]|uniref:ImmA/IrrE family metallo-endopeptidase n=1 Tax=Nocardioides baculatus TaxID=2801337 RepID=A0ABS1L5L8_9ACTN|nr:ImmA/IrrE family metallo-endopeptidase [Nocardioides baculatus]MBL0746728.1 ImmA/IrrE family metallo-endopeptidase [Nocardioides baculatus]